MPSKRRLKRELRDAEEQCADLEDECADLRRKLKRRQATVTLPFGVVTLPGPIRLQGDIRVRSASRLESLSEPPDAT